MCFRHTGNVRARAANIRTKEANIRAREANIRAKVGFFLVSLMIHVLFRKFSFSFWTMLSMITSDNVVEDALRTSAADSTVGIQRRDSL